MLTGIGGEGGTRGGGLVTRDRVPWSAGQFPFSGVVGVTTHGILRGDFSPKRLTEG